MNNKKNLQKEMQRRIDIANGDPIEYMMRFNRHTLRVSLTNEQVNKELWEGSDITFFNEDNAISHLTLINDLLELLTQEENKMWGTGMADNALVERITKFIVKKVSPPKAFEGCEDELMPLTDFVKKSQKLEEEEEN